MIKAFGNTKGFSKVGNVIFFGLIAAGIFYIVKIAPAFIIYYQVQGAMTSEVNRMRKTDWEGAKASLVKKFIEIEAKSIDPEKIQVTFDDESKFVISVDYTEVVDFFGQYQQSFSFSPRVERKLQE
jgi:hypothetical protein